MSQNRVPGNQMLRIMGKFDGAFGRFMYHCHLLEHEDMGMMRPFVVMPEEAMKFAHGGAQGGHGEGHTGCPSACAACPTAARASARTIGCGPEPSPASS